MRNPPCPPPSPCVGLVVLIVCSGLSALLFFTSCAGLQRVAPKGHVKDTAPQAASTPAEGSLWQPLPEENIGKLFPYGLAFDPETKNIFFTDIINNVICVQQPSGAIGVFTQSADLGLSLSLALDYVSPMTLIIADTRNKRICAVTPKGIAQDLVMSNGRVTGLAVAPGGAIYYSDFDACTVVKATSDGTQTVVAGVGSPGYSGDGAEGASAALNGPYGLALHANRLFIADSLNQRIRVLDLESGTIQTFAGNGTRGDTLPTSSISGLDVALNDPRDVAVDAEGNVYVLNTFGASIPCFDSNGMFLPGRVKAELGKDERPASGLVVDGEFVYTDLVTPHLPRRAPIAAEMPEPPSPPAESSPPTEAAAAEPPPAEQPQTPAAEEPKEPPKPPARPAPDTTTLRLEGPEFVVDGKSAAYTLVLDLAPNVQVGAVEAQVHFDPQQLKLAFTVAHQGPGTDSWRTHISQTPDSVAFTMHTRAGTLPPSGTVELCDLLFECVGDSAVPTVISFEIPAPSVLSLDGMPVPTQAENFKTTNFYYGDASLDNKINLMDALLLLHSGEEVDSGPTQNALLAGDVDLDGELTIADALAVVRAMEGEGQPLPTTPPRKKSGWSDKDEMLQDTLANELTGEDPFNLTGKPEQEKEDLQAEWAKKLDETGAALFVQVPEYVPEDQRQVLLDIMLALPAGKQIGAFEVTICFDSTCGAVEKILVDDQSPHGILGKGRISETWADLGGVCRYPGDATATTVKLASLLVALKPPSDAADWDTVLHPVVTQLVDYQGAALFGFGVPATIRSYRLGDITRDGGVDQVDLILLLECLTGIKDINHLRSQKAADLDGDGEHTIRDAVLLMNLVNGKDLFDVTTPSGKQLAALHAVRRILHGDQDVLPAMVDLLQRKSRAASVDEALTTHGVIELDAPAIPGKGGYFLGTVEYQPGPNASLGGYQLVVECDPDVVSIQTVMSAAAMESIDQPLVYRVSENRDQLILAQIPDVEASKDAPPLLLASILFLMKTESNAPPTSTTIRLTGSGVLDRQGEYIEAIYPAHTISNFHAGDVNNDGLVERLDEVLLTRLITGEITREAFENPAAADLNLDGQVDMSDVVLLEQATLGEAGLDVVRRARQREAIAEEIVDK
ncbi:MAG: dockerin type I domain-containing protein [bacterium]